MKLYLLCYGCIESWGDEQPSIEQIGIARVSTPLHNSLFYEFTCSKGHESKVILQNTKYELLFESAINALRDGYYREAVSGFAVSMERFHEYCIRILLSRNKEIEADSYVKAWKAISKQSERQLGAFYILYLNAFKKPALLFDSNFLKQRGLHLEFEGNDPIAFRNRAIHEGYIPTYKQALTFGEAVNFYIRTIVRELAYADYDIIAPTREDSGAAQLKHSGERFNIECNNTFMSLTNTSTIDIDASLIDSLNTTRLFI